MSENSAERRNREAAEERAIDAFIEEKYVTVRQRRRMISKVPEDGAPCKCGIWEANFMVENVYPKSQTVSLYYNLPDGTTKTITEERE